jgi:alpha-glucosidase
MVAEAWVTGWDRLVRYLRPGEYHQAFNFLFLQAPWKVSDMKNRIAEALDATASVGSKPTWVLSNHDVVRHATRYGLPQDIDERVWLLHGDRSLLDEEKGLRRARAAALLMLALPGSVYLYQGEELGLPEVHDLPLEVLDDPVWERSGHRHKGRDGCRVPVPWTEEGPGYGFCDREPWLPQPDDWGELSVEAQSGVEGSTLELYRKALELRRGHVVGESAFSWLDMGREVLAFNRGSLTCVVNFGDTSVDMPDGEVLISSEPLAGRLVPEDTAVWLYVQ